MSGLIEIVPYSPVHRAAIERMNTRLAAAGSEWQFPAGDEAANGSGLPVWNEHFLVLDEGDAYGGYILKHQQFFSYGRPLDVGDLQLPLSLGQVDSAYAHVSAAIVFDVRRRSPLCYSLGLGSDDSQFARLLAAAGWQHIPVPFYFKVVAANRFARNIRLPASKARSQRVLRVLGHLRLAGLALRLRRMVGSRPSSERIARDDASAREIELFDRSADDVFAAASSAYSLVGDRSAKALNTVFADDDDRYIRVVVERAGRTVGWALLLDTTMKDDQYFGDLRVGTLVDCFAAPEEAHAVVAAADDVLARRGVDLAISNQLHPAWCKALELTGYESGPSNFFFYYSEGLVEALSDTPDWELGTHMNRGDGEGPGHL